MWSAPAFYLAAVAAVVFGAPELLTAGLALVCVVFIPGLAWARRRADPLDRLLLAGWLGVGSSAVCGLFARAFDLGPLGVLACAATLAAAAPAPRPRERWALGPALGLLAAVVALGLWGLARGPALARPLDAYWWDAGAESLAAEARAPEPAEGWARQKQGPWKEWGARKLDPREANTVLIGPTDGPLLLLLRGPVGARLWAGEAHGEVRASPTVSKEEGPVWRYTDAGVAALRVDDALQPGERLELTFSHPDHSSLYVLPSTDALWALHNSGELVFTHYYQLLNMVEQLRWAEERWVTDVQPPLGSWALGGVLAVGRGGLPTANLWMLASLGLCALAGLRLLRRFAPDAPAPAWLLPGAAAVVHGRLVLDAGSAGMPDSLYAAAILSALSGPIEAGGLLAQLLRYPGTGVVAVGALLAGEGARALRLLGLVAAVAAAFGLGGLLSGALPGWLETVAWETGPEHWHGEHDPMVLVSRMPAFYLAWITYAGGTPLLAALRWTRGTKVLLGTALAYSLLLATIDHRPTHYFLPLVHLAVIALGCTAAGLQGRLRWALPLLGLLGLSIWELRGPIFD